MCLNTGTPKNINVSFETNGKLMALGIPILEHFRALQDSCATKFRTMQIRLLHFYFFYCPEHWDSYKTISYWCSEGAFNDKKG